VLVDRDDGASNIAVDSPAWYVWLEDATTFAFTSDEGSFTAHKERRGQTGWYWKAYRKHKRTLHRAYLGKSTDLTLARLIAVASELTQRAADVPPHEAPRLIASPPDPADSKRPDLPGSQLPAGTLTFLFTDIEGSTQLWERYPQTMPLALARHDALLRHVIVSRHGVVFKSVGDGIYAAFASAADAVAAARGLQSSLRATDWGEIGSLRVRTVLHTGLAELRGGDYFGPPLNRTARLMAVGHGGQVLLSSVTAQVVRDQLPAGVTLRSLGAYQLKDLQQPEAIFQLCAPDLPADFLPLRATSVPSRDAHIQLLATKLYVPRTRPDLVARPQLFARLAAGLRGTLTLVCAPAGFGKTTLLIQALEARGWRLEKDPLASSLQPPAPRVAWVSLDAGDNDPARFWSYALTALDRLYPGVGDGALGLLQAPQPPPIEAVLATLLNGLSSRVANRSAIEPDVFVLDDYHVIETPAIHQAMNFLLDHLPPALHVVIATREDPPLALSRLRARSQLHELRATRLRFSHAESSALLIDTMGLQISEADVAPIAERTEGWVAGLQLTALALQNRTDYHDFLAAFTGSNRFVADYLVEEVFARQLPHIQQFLLHTSILDRMCGSLCDAVLGVTNDELLAMDSATDELLTRHPLLITDDSYSQLILRELERANLFLVPLDDERRWYRYHHLFGDVLRYRLTRSQPNQVPGLHLRASVWFERHGLAVEAIEYAIQAKDFERAGRLVDEHSDSVRMHGGLATLLRWLTTLPDIAFEARPRLALNHALILALMDYFEPAERRLDAAERALHAAPVWDAELLGQAAVVRACIALQTDLPAEMTLAAGRQALELLPPSKTIWRALAGIFLGVGYYVQAGDLVAGYQTLVEVERASIAADDPFGASNAAAHATIVLEVGGRLRESERRSRELLQRATEPFWQGVPLGAYARFSLGRVLYERNELHLARQHLAEAIQQLEAWALKRALVIATVLMARVEQALSEPLRARESMARAMAIVQKDDLKQTFSHWASYRVRIALAQGDMEVAREWVEEVEPTTRGALNPVLEFKQITLAHVYLAQQRLDDAEQLLDRLLPAAQSTGRWGRVLEIYILQAVTAKAQGRLADAHSMLEQALRLGEPEGYIRTFVDAGAPVADLLRKARARAIMPSYVEKLLVAFPDDDKETRRQGDQETGARSDGTISLSPNLPVSRALVEPLTARELEVLGLLAEGASNDAIARRLIVSLGTVKKHLSNIFGKLQVESRTQAVARARALGLLEV
jgi:LuxR family maltose regulon positive regulatory protein